LERALFIIPFSDPQATKDYSGYPEHQNADQGKYSTIHLFIKSNIFFIISIIYKVLDYKAIDYKAKKRF